MPTLMSGISHVGSRELHVIVEDAEHKGSQQAPTDQNGTVDTGDEKRTVRKIDWSIMPVLMLLYTLGFMDRVSLGDAAIAGMDADLKLEDIQFNIAVAVFYPSYILTDVLSNLILRFTCASLVLAGFMLAWGFATLLISFVV